VKSPSSRFGFGEALSGSSGICPTSDVAV